MRKYNISATIVLQDIAQIEAMYEDNWKTLVGNCSSIVFLGSQEPNTLKYFSEDMLGDMTIRTKSTGMSNGGKSSSSKNFQYTGRKVMTANELARMPSDECIVLMQNHRPVRDKKYRYENHPYYDQTADADEKNGFKYNTMSVYDNAKTGRIKSLLRAVSDGQRILDKEKQEARKFQKAEEKLIQGDLTAEAGEVSLSPESEKQNDANLFARCLMDAVDGFENAVCVISAAVPPGRKSIEMLEKVRGASGLEHLILFSETEPVNDDDLLLYGFAKRDDRLLELLNSMKKYIQSMQVTGGYIFLAVSRHRFDIFKNTILSRANA